MNIHKLFKHLGLALLLLALGTTGVWAGETADEQSIKKLLKDTFEKPESPLKVYPITITGDYAVAGWLQDDRGGRALLKKENGAWILQACGGDGLKSPGVLEKSGMSRINARKLVSAIGKAENRLPESEVKKFSELDDSMK